MEISLKSARKLSSRIASAYIAKVQDEESYGLLELATTSSYGFRVELSLSSAGIWLFDETSIDFVETAGCITDPNAGDFYHGIAGYMPETALVKPDDPLHKIDSLVKLWGASLPSLYEKDLGDQDRWGQFERFRALIVDNPGLQGKVQEALLDRVDKNFGDQLHDSVRRWLEQGYKTLAATLLDE